ncbi:hypothetical protein D6833_04085 [Candidatus Parcubacteria bacterium]|nr:MAG: hypothetical protein D6833_04085 [Candidatus Parcubacteria bacterium]
MKFLFDMPVSPELAKVVEEFGHEGFHAYALGLDKAQDEDILKFARTGGYVVVTADLDFPRLLALSSADGPGLILFRGGNYSELEMRELLRRVLAQVSAEVIASAICVVDKKRIRITRLPVQR